MLKEYEMNGQWIIIKNDLDVNLTLRVARKPWAQLHES